MKRLVLVMLVASSVALAAGPNLSASHRAMFCGLEGAEETSLIYAEAVRAELERREARGKSTKDALRDMRVDYCAGSSK